MPRNRTQIALLFWVWAKYQIMLMMYWICQKDGSLLIIIHFSSHVKFFAISSSRVNYSSYLLLCMKLWQNNNFYCILWFSGLEIWAALSWVVLLSYVVWSDIFQWYYHGKWSKGPKTASFKGLVPRQEGLICWCRQSQTSHTSHLGLRAPNMSFPTDKAEAALPF